MDEYFLQFLWKFQKFETSPLTLTNGESLVVFRPGFQNNHSGPDFHEARIKINELTWSGSVEIHYRSSDWIRHQHQKDSAYENVVLHVVWIADQEILIDDTPIPTFEMSRFVEEKLESNYRKYISRPDTILCSGHMPQIQSIQKRAMLDRALMDRLETKSHFVLELLAQKGGDWEAVTYQMIARNFGFKTNAGSFAGLATSLPYSVVRKHHGDPFKMDALIFGMAGFLEESSDEYQNQLLEEFSFLAKKYQLTPILSRHHWKHSKMRPANFPTVRLAQFSALLAHNQGLFNSLIRLETKIEIKNFLKKPPNEYWKNHYDFGKLMDKKTSLGESSLNLIMINTAAPILAAYGKHLDNISYIERAQAILEAIKPESNNITRQWVVLGMEAENAADSQSLIHQYNTMCLKKKCLECNIGMSILNRV